MQLEPKDYVSVAALLVSLVSLALSARVGRFGRRTKLIELRAALLAKVNEAAVVTTQLERIQNEFLSIGTDDPRIKELIDPSDVAANRRDIATLYAALSAAPTSSADSLYETHFHEMNHIVERTRALAERTQSTMDRYVQN
jgi:hypothetical protein